MALGRLSGVAIGIVVVALVFAIGAVILGGVQSSTTDMNMTAEAQSAVNKVFSQSWNAYNLLPIVIFIIAAGAVIYAIRGFGGE